jgi:transcriptional regulator with XRE-family HTH domain
MKTKLTNKYTREELVDSFVFRTNLTPKQEKESISLLQEARQKNKQNIKSNHIILASILQLKYQIDEYINLDIYDENRSFGTFLRFYLKSLGIKNKDFAKDIDIEETELSQLLNQHRKPSDKIIIRLEIHSNKTIPAITWLKLLEKEKEHEISTNDVIRKNESKHVKNRLQFG